MIKLLRKPPEGYAAKHGGGWWKWVAKAIQVNMESIWALFLLELVLAVTTGLSRLTLWSIIITVVSATLAIIGVSRWERSRR